MKRLAMCLLALAAIVPLAASCGKKKEEQATSQTREKVRIAISGSDTTYGILKALSNSYGASHPDVNFDFLPSSHTGGGINGAYNREIDLGATSRTPLKEEEKLGMVYYEIANDGLVFTVEQKVPLKDVSVKQIKDMYAGKISKWSELGLKGMENDDIVVIDRPPHASARMVLDEILFGKEFPFSKKLVMIERASDTVEALAKTPNALGYTSQQAVVMGKLPVTMLSIDGVAPTFDNVKSGKYIYVRPFGVVYRPDAKKAVMEFVDFIKSPEGRKIILDEGLVPGE